MSRLLVVTRPSLTPGFDLAGVEAFAVANVEEAQQLIGRWLDEGETGLMAIDEEMLTRFDPLFMRRLESADHLPHIAIPSGEPAMLEISNRQRLAELIRRAIGFHITFKGSA